MNDEVSKYVTILNNLQRTAYDNGGLSQTEKSLWRETHTEIKKLGYTSHHKRVNGRYMWYVKPANSTSQRNSECPYIYTNVRPNRKCLKSDCSTRAMTFCLNGTLSYDEIERKQYALANQRRTRRNTNGTWERVIYQYDYEKVQFSSWCKPKRSVVGSWLSNMIAHPVISHSSGHVAVIDKSGAVRDTWDSRGGKVDSLIVHTDDILRVREILNGHGIKTAVVSRMV